MLQISAAILGGSLFLFGVSHTMWVLLVLMAFTGFGLMQCASVSNTIVQSLVTEDKRARVMSYYTMAFFGAAPFGSLLAGGLANRIGAPHTVMFTGACCIAGALWFTLELPKIGTVMQRVMYERIEQHLDRETGQEIGQEMEQGQVLLPDGAAHDD